MISKDQPQDNVYLPLYREGLEQGLEDEFGHSDLYFTKHEIQDLTTADHTFKDGDVFGEYKFVRYVQLTTLTPQLRPIAAKDLPE